jgi:hypothetical protein
MKMRGIMVKTISVTLDTLGIKESLKNFSPVKLANRKDNPDSVDISIDSNGNVYCNYDTPPTVESEKKIRELLE